MGVYLKISEAAKILDMNPQTLKNIIADGEIGYRKTRGGHYRIPENELRKYLDKSMPGWEKEAPELLDRVRRPVILDRAISAKTVAETLGVSMHVVRNMCQAGRLKGFRTAGDSGDWRISLNSVKRFMNREFEREGEPIDG